MSGTIIERRDQVLMTFLVPFSFCTSTFFCRWSSTKGPFFRLRGMCQGSSALLAGTTATDDQLVAVLVGTTGAALGLAPRAHRVTATGGLALTATVRVVDRVHRDSTDRRVLSPHPRAAALA